MRPKTLEDFFGQDQILGKNRALRTLIEKDRLSSVIFYGPSGTGKTSLAKLISQLTQAEFVELNATDSSVKEVREICKKAGDNKRFYSKKTILFIDEVHRFNKAQQDVLLPFVESRDIVFIGATTFNPFFYITPALSSRTVLFEFKKLDSKALMQIFKKTASLYQVTFSDEAIDYLIKNSNGDARILLNRLETVLLIKEEGQIELQDLKEFFPSHAFSYERAEDHYDVISAFIKSVRGSDPDAAVYYLAVMLEGGEDIRFIARRLAILAAEDIGLAEPGALAVIAGGYELVEKIGMPEARIILSEMTVYLACLPKSNSAYLAIDKAAAHVKENPVMKIPPYLKDTHAVGRTKDYKYPHDFDNHYIEQKYTDKPVQFYHPGFLGREKPLKDYLEFIKKIK